MRKAQEEELFLRTYHKVEDYKDRANRVLYRG
jgi:hypothetical protein